MKARFWCRTESINEQVTGVILLSAHVYGSNMENVHFLDELDELEPNGNKNIKSVHVVDISPQKKTNLGAV